jgi:hypothetical protein
MSAEFDFVVTHHQFDHAVACEKPGALYCCRCHRELTVTEWLDYPECVVPEV